MSDIGYATLPIIASMQGTRAVIDRELNGVGGAAGDRAGRDFGQGFERSSSGPLSRIRSMLGTIAKGAGIVALSAVAAGGALAGFGIKGAADLEQTTTAFTSLLGSSQAATDEIKALQKYAAATPFSQTDVIGYAQQFFSLANSIGLSKAQVIPFLDAVGNLGAVTGASTQNIHNAVMAIGQIGSAGKVTLDNLNQISEAFPGFNGAAAIAAATGQTTAQVMKQISAGSLDAKTGVQALLIGMQKFPGAAGAMTKQSQTLKGLWSTFTDTLSIQLTKAFQPVLPTLKKTLAQLTPIIAGAVKNLAPAIAAFIKNLAPIIGPLLQGLGTALKAIFQALGPVLAALAPVIKPLATAFAQLVVAVTPLLTLFARAIATVGPPLLQLFVSLATAVTPLINAFVSALGPVLPQIAKAFAAIGAALTPVVAALANALAPVLPILANAFRDIAVALAPVVAALSQAFVKVIDKLAPQMPALAKSFADLAVALANMLPALIPIVNLFAKFVVLVGGPTLEAITKIIEAVSKLIDYLSEAVDIMVALGKSVTLQGVGSLSPDLQAIADSLSTVGTVSKGASSGLLSVLGATVGLGGVLGAAAAGADAMADALARLAGEAAIAAAALIPIVGPALGIASAALNLPKAPRAAAAGTPGFSLPSGGGAGAAAATKPPAFDQGTLTSFLSAVGIQNNPLTDALNAIFKSAAASGQRIGNPLAAALKAENSRLKGLVSERDSIAKALDRAQAALTAAKDKYNNERSSVKSAVTGTFDLGSISTQYGEPVTLYDITTQLAQAVRNATRFTAVLKRLAKEGLAKGLLQQLAAAGPGALSQAEALLTATPKQLAAINSSYKALGTQGDNVGKFMADDLYGAGVQAAQGLVNGLKSKESALTKAVKGLAEAMVAQLRRSLDMHSPSRRLFSEGALAFEGYRLGIASKGADIEREALNLANRSMPDSKIRASHAAAAGGGRVQYVTINQNIQNPIPEAPSRTTPASIRRAAYALGK